MGKFDRINYLKVKIFEFQKELELLEQEKKIKEEIANLKKNYLNRKLDGKKELVENALKFCEYKEIVSENGKKYYITKEGDVFSETKKITKTHQKNGYDYVSIDGKSKLLHRLMWETFNGEIPEGYEIDHLNTVRTDNRLENLRLTTPKENRNNPHTIEKYKMANRNKGVVRIRREKKMSENLEINKI